MNELDIILYLGKRGAFISPIPVTTSKMGSDLGESQQNISRWLIKMENEELIQRKNGIKGYLVQITPKGENFILMLRNDIEAALMRKNRITIKGVINTGIGDGKYYMSQKEYIDYFRDNFGFKPYPGTLNIKITGMTDIRQKERICGYEGIEIKSFTKGNRIFGSLKCFKCKINDIDCVIVIPKRSHHPFDILEVVSDVNLREKLKLKDEDTVTVEIKLKNY